MKKALILFVAVLLTAAGCTSPTYINRTQPRYGNRYGHPNYDHHRYNRGYSPGYGRNW